ncbi:MAG TPA: hypothetical protein VI339_01880 [Steroidobacteraceae bacterium]|nr:hypothetical protein [Steroidobacteraceae bacterium]
MNTEMSPRIRSFVSGLTAVAITSVLMITLTESLNPALLQSSAESSAPEKTAAVGTHGSTALIRKA